jgi:uncharacterized protein
MKIGIAGGSGQVGRVLRRAFASRNEVVVLTRRPAGEVAEKGVKWVRWDGERIGDWAKELEGAEVLINLAGRSVNCRYGAENRREIIESRVKSTRVLGEAVARLKSPPRVWLQASTATIYAHVPPGGAAHDESGVIGGKERGVPETWRFSIEVATSWERAFDELKLPGTRKVKLRSAMVMSPDAGGVFDTLLMLVKRRLGGRAGDGRQYVSWVHERDFVRALQWILEREEFTGFVNICAPNPLPNDEFMRALRSAAGVGFGLPAARWMLEIGAVFMRTETELILKSRRVVPGWLLKSGFKFEFPEWGVAAKDLCRRGAPGN